MRLVGLRVVWESLEQLTARPGKIKWGNPIRPLRGSFISPIVQVHG